MKISHNVKREIEEEVVDDVLCNMCGNSCRAYNYDGLIEYTIECGYGSKLGDGNYYTFSLCEDCLKLMFGKFKLPVTVAAAGWASDFINTTESKD
jgi:hypothetical protein